MHFGDICHLKTASGNSQRRKLRLLEPVPVSVHKRWQPDGYTGYALPGTHSHPLIFVGIHGVSHGCRSRTWGLHHSVDVLAQYGAHPYQHTETILTHLPHYIYPVVQVCSHKNMQIQTNSTWRMLFISMSITPKIANLTLLFLPITNTVFVYHIQ